jgi:hypothetical protein
MIVFTVHSLAFLRPATRVESFALFAEFWSESQMAA